MKVYELDAFRVTHASKYAAPVLSVGLSPNCALLAVGLADGQLLARKHSHNKGPAASAAPGARLPLRTGPQRAVVPGSRLTMHEWRAASMQSR